MLVQVGTYLIERFAKYGERLVELAAHPDSLRTLAGKQERDPSTTHRCALQHPRCALAPCKRAETPQKLTPLPPQHYRAILEPRATRQREPNIHHTKLLITTDQVLPQPPRLRTQPTHTTTRKHPRHHTPLAQDRELPTNSQIGDTSSTGRLQSASTTGGLRAGSWRARASSG